MVVEGQDKEVNIYRGRESAAHACSEVISPWPRSPEERSHASHSFHTASEPSSFSEKILNIKKCKGQSEIVYRLCTTETRKT